MLADILHKVAEFDEEESHPYSPRPSLAGPERCIRSLDYYAQGCERKPFPGRFITVLDDSSWHEQLIKDWIRKSAFQIHSEQMEVICGHVNGRPMKGHIDGVITDILGHDRLLEIKAISHFGFQDVWNGHLPLDYITQTCLYLRGLKEVNPEISEALLFIKNKNQSQYLEILIRYDLIEIDRVLIIEMTLSTGEKKDISQTIDNITQQAISRFIEVAQYRDEDKRHDRQYGRISWRCDYCPYGAICWEGWEDEFEALSVDTVLDEEAETLCRYYLETNLHLGEMEKEKDKLKAQIKELLKKHDSRKAQAGDYVITNDLRSKKSIDQEKIPPAILEAAMKVNYFETFTIRFKKEKTK